MAQALFWSLCVFCSFINIFLSFGKCWKKMSIMGEEQALRLYCNYLDIDTNPRFFSTFLGLTFIVFLLPYAGSQFIGGGKLFSVVTGNGNYRVGVLLFALITFALYADRRNLNLFLKLQLYKEAIMIFSVIAIFVATGGELFD